MKYIKGTFSFSILAFLLIYTFLNRGVFTLDKLPYILGTFICAIGFQFLLSSAFFIFFKSKIRLSELFLLNILTSFLNLLIPARGGVVYRAIKLKKDHGIPISRYASISFLLSIASLTLLGLLSLIASQFIEVNDLQQTISISSILLFVGGLVFLISPNLMKRIDFFKKRPFLFDSFHFKKVLSVFVSYLCSVLIYSTKTYCLLKIFNVDLSTQDIVIVSIFHLSIGLVNLLPGNLGLKELSFVGICTIFQIDPSVSLSVVAFDRVVQVIFLSTGAVLYSLNGKTTLFKVVKTVNNV